MRMMMARQQRVWVLFGWLTLLGLSAPWLVGCSSGDQQQIERAIVGRGRIVVLAEHSSWELRPSGTILVPLSSVPSVAEALRGSDPAALTQAMTAANVQGLLLDLSAPPNAGIGKQLADLARVSGLEGEFFNRSAAFYKLDPLRTLSPTLREGLAVVARRLLAGAPPPRITAFPAEVRRLDPVEVMVLLRSGKDPRLWRSARGSSFARALLTATAVARQRWIERSASLGGRLDAVLPSMSVEVSLLSDDGELGTRNESFVNRVVTAEHGIGFERKGSWHYMLPTETHKQGRAPTAAYRKLFADNGIAAESLGDADLRLYRVAVQGIGTSPPTANAAPDDGLSDVKSPIEVLEKTKQ